jgi:opacity protein-like surface antigen
MMPVPAWFMAFVFSLSPFLGTPMDSDVRDFSGKYLYGFEASFRAPINQRFSLGLLTGLGTSALKDETGLDVAAGDNFVHTEYTQAVRFYHVPVQALALFHMRPMESLNPYLGVAIGGSIAHLSVTATDVPSGSEISAKDLSAQVDDFLFAASPLAGLDWAITDHVGLFFNVKYTYLSKFAYTHDALESVILGGARRVVVEETTEKIDFSHLGGNLGLNLYF